MLYTRKGDEGTTRTLNSQKGERISKASCQIESLGALDELDSFLGLLRVKSADILWQVGGKKAEEVIKWVQNCLFIIQAETAGSDKKIQAAEITELERLTDGIEKELPLRKSFSLPGGTELSAMFDIARTLARKTERRIISGVNEGVISIGKDSLAFMNRLSSLLYALARLVNVKAGAADDAPWYN